MERKNAESVFAKHKLKRFFEENPPFDADDNSYSQHFTMRGADKALYLPSLGGCRFIHLPQVWSKVFNTEFSGIAAVIAERGRVEKRTSNIYQIFLFSIVRQARGRNGGQPARYQIETKQHLLTALSVLSARHITLERLCSWADKQIINQLAFPAA